MATPAREDGMRSYGPGKFDTILDSLVHRLSLDHRDDEIGDANWRGWYGLMEGPFDPADLTADTGEILNAAEAALIEQTLGVILTEDSQGFVTVAYFSDVEHLRLAWSEIVDREVEAEQEGLDDE